jgi:hypothetical protein
MGGGVGLACLVLLGGAVAPPFSCQEEVAVRAAPAPFPRPRHPSPELLAALNENARRAGGMVLAWVSIEAREGGHTVGLNGQLALGQAGRARLIATVLGQRWLDAGSNDREAWCQLRGKKLIRVRHGQAGGRAQDDMFDSLLFQLGWVRSMLGRAVWGSPREYQVAQRGRHLELTERAVTPTGRAVRRITIVEQTGKQVRIVGHRLEGSGGETIVSCSVLRFRRDGTTGLDVPTRLRVLWPTWKFEIQVSVDRLECAPPANDEQARRLFTAPGGE